MADIKNAQANEFLNRAAALETELADPSKVLTYEEVEQRVNEIKALKTRAVSVSRVREEALEVRAAAGEITLPNPEAAAADAMEQETMQSLSQRVVSAFGSPGRYVLALARRASPEAKTWTTRQQEAHRAFRAFQARTSPMVGTGSDASGGEFLLPDTLATDIFVGAQIVQPGLFERAPHYPCPGRSVKIPYLQQSDRNDTRPLSSISATAIESEAGEKDEKVPSIAQRQVIAYKWAAYTEIADELLEDDATGQLASVLQRAVGGDIQNSINLSVTIGGSGSSQPLGALHANNGALITIPRDTSQSVIAADVFGMMGVHTMGPGSFWLANPATLPSLMALELSSGSRVSFLPDLTGKPGGTLLGFPLVWSYLASPLGVDGDLALIDPAHYAVVARRGLTMESSIHYKFRNDVTAYRFYARAGGAPIPISTYAFKSTGSAKIGAFSPFVQLGDAITS